MSTEFVEGWEILQTLGEGAFGEVKLLLNKVSGDAVAMKIVDLVKNPGASDSIRKEIAIHKKLNSPHIIKVYGNRKEQGIEYIFLEYASGGELFDRIEPDRGMKPQDAQKYFKQLISGVEYLHTMGIVHRDLKPENLLLDEHDNLKITDFGMATIFRMNGKDRMLDKKCGTLPYVAPEVLSGKPYHGEPADVWSCGVVLVAMLAGELPWDSPTNCCPDYVSWKECGITKQPWCKIDNLALSILRRILNHSPSRRYKINEIKQHQWFTKQFRDQVKILPPPSHKAVRMVFFVASLVIQLYDENELSCGFFTKAAKGNGDQPVLSIGSFWLGIFVQLGVSTPVKLPGTPVKKRPRLSREYTSIIEESARLACSQPVPSDCNDNDCDELEEMPCRKNPLGLCSFSQPTNPEHMLLTSQLQTQTQSGTSQTPLHRLVKRMTRCLMHVDFDRTRKELGRILDRIGYAWREFTPGMFTISCQDRRKMDLTFKANAISMNGAGVLLDFRLSRGCGIEFKRQFVRIRDKLKEFVSDVPMTWSLADATNALP